MKKNILLSVFTLTIGIAVFAENDDPERYPRPFKKVHALAWDFNLPVVKTVMLPSQVKLEYVEQGDPNGTPVIFLHGITDSWHSYDRVLPYLPSSIHAFAISMRGHGNSDRPWSGYSPEDFAADIAAFMKKLKIKSAVIVGHSMGATIARHFVTTYPGKSQGLVLIGSFASFPNNPGVMEFNKLVSDLTDPVDPAFAKEFQVSTLAQAIPPAYLDTVVNESLKLPARVWKSALDGMMKDTKALKVLKTPGLIIYGAKDSFVPRADQDVLNAMISKSKLIIYQQAGHAVHWEEPERFVKDLLSFIQNIK